MLVEYLPPVVRQIREMKEICAAEQPEFDLLAQQVDQILANMFILLANEEGIERFEKELKITPKPTDTLEDRRLNVLSRANKSKVTTALIMSIISNYSAATELIKDFDNDELTIVLNADASSLQTVYGILDEKIPLNIYYDFLLQRTYNIGINICSKIYQMYDRAAGDQETCGNENQITRITKTAYNINVSGFCNINPVTAAGQTICGAAVDEVTTQPTFTTESVQVNLTQTQSASIAPVARSGEEYAGEEA